MVAHPNFPYKVYPSLTSALFPTPFLLWPHLDEISGGADGQHKVHKLPNSLQNQPLLRFRHGTTSTVDPSWPVKPKITAQFSRIHTGVAGGNQPGVIGNTP
jgi:hypothetical protein